MNKASVIIKSFPNGISLRLDAEAPWEEILRETEEKFEAGRYFFKDAAVALTFEERALSQAEEDELLALIGAHSDLRIVCLCARERQGNLPFVQAIDRAGNILREKEAAEARFAPDEPLCRMHFGDVTGGAVVETKENLLVLGDVAPGCAVVAGGSLFVLGRLQGEAEAGTEQTDGQGSAIVFALDLSPEKLLIGGIRARAPKSRRGLFGKAQPRIARVRDGVVVVEEAKSGSFS